MISILYDGWALIHAPNSPAALHLLTLLAALPEEVQPHVALPDSPPGWLLEGAGDRAAVHIQQAPGTPRGRLGWEQSWLPRLASQVGARLLHLVTPTPPLLGPARAVVSPATFDTARASRTAYPFAERVREAVSGGGMARARAVLWPADLPVPGRSPGSGTGTDPGGRALAEGAPFLPIPPAVHPLFSLGRVPAAPDLAELDLPETYVLYHGPSGREDLERLLQAWSWAAGPVGEYYPLLLAGLEEDAHGWLAGRLSQAGLGESVRALPYLSPAGLARLYAGCAALFHPAPLAPWGSPVRHALALGKPVVALQNAWSEALVGPAAYLAPGAGRPVRDATGALAPEAGLPGRDLGAALITVLVEEELSASLAQAALQRAAAWDPAEFSRALGEAYQKLTG